jgi:hypothetical protein
MKTKSATESILLLRIAHNYALGQRTKKILQTTFSSYDKLLKRRERSHLPGALPIALLGSKR